MRKFANMASTRVTGTRELISVSECKTILPQNWMCAISKRWTSPFSSSVWPKPRWIYSASQPCHMAVSCWARCSQNQSSGFWYQGVNGKFFFKFDNSFLPSSYVFRPFCGSLHRPLIAFITRTRNKYPRGEKFLNQVLELREVELEEFLWFDVLYPGVY